MNADPQRRGARPRQGQLRLLVILGAVVLVTVFAAIVVSLSRDDGTLNSPVGSTQLPDPSESPTDDATDSLDGDESSYEIPTGLDDEALGKFIVEDAFSDWMNAGASEALITRAASQNITMAAAIQQVSEEQAVKWAEALYIPEWEADAVLAEDVRVSREGNANVLTNYAATAWSSDEHPENVEPYRQWQEVEGPVRVVAKTDTERTLAIDYVETNNGDKNMIGPMVGNVHRTLTITFRVVDGIERIAAISDVAR